MKRSFVDRKTKNAFQLRAECELLGARLSILTGRHATIRADRVLFSSLYSTLPSRTLAEAPGRDATKETFIELVCFHDAFRYLRLLGLENIFPKKSPSFQLGRTASIATS